MHVQSKFIRPVESLARLSPLLYQCTIRRLFSYSSAAADRYNNTDSDYSRGSGDRGNRRNNRDSDNVDFNRDNNYRSGSNFESKNKSYGNQSDVGSRLRDINWDSEQMKPFEKNLYKIHPDVESRTPELNNEMLKELQATLRGRDIPYPISSFDEIAPTFGEKIMSELKGTGFTNPSPVQKFAWPILSSGRDSVGVAQTGSGKTLAYMLPALNHIQNQSPLEYGDGPIALIMGPTRELVAQIQTEAIKFGHLTGIHNAVAYGGEARQRQAMTIRKGAHILVATPGRLLDFIESGVVNLKRVTYLVLDEADRMLDMGFEKDIRKIVGQSRPDRQTLMFSATWPTEIQRLARDFCREAPTMVTIGSTELQCNPDIAQDIVVVPEMERRDHFFNWLMEINEKSEIDGAKSAEKKEGEFAFEDGKQQHLSKILVFTDTKRGADALQRDMRYRGIDCAAIHGDKQQNERNRVLHDFRTGRLQVLVATDVAQRGLDIKDVKFVVNFDLPKTIEDYVHRIGRTGRAGSKGTAITYFSYDYYSTEKVKMAKSIASAMKDVGQKPPQKLIEIGNQRPS